MGIFKLSTNHNETTGLPMYYRGPAGVTPALASAAGLVLGLVLGLGLVSATALYAISRYE